MDLREYAEAFDEVERDFEAAVEKFGVPFERKESAPREERARVAAACGCHCENGGFSLWRNWLSPACAACRTGEETATFFIDLKCTKSCYFCFNPNQDHYDYFRTHKRDIVRELERAHDVGARFRCLAITGGEPMLYPGEVEAFLRRAGELYPGAHTRLYTSGDLLDEAGLRALADAGLAEIRFSVKPPDADDGQERVYALMERAAAVLPDVVVEVPVIPGSRAWMEELLRRSDAAGARGVNLLEFCFPLHNGAEFAKRGFKLRKRPFKYLYDYWYGGGVPVAGSEVEALALMEFASREGLRLGVHYCSSDNKNTGQIFQQNKAFFADADLRAAHPWMSQDEGDRFLKCAKAFGEDARRAREWAARAGVPCGFDAEVRSAALPLACADALARACPGIKLAESASVVERREPEAGSARETEAAGAGPQAGARPERLSAHPGLYLREVAVMPKASCDRT